MDTVFEYKKDLIDYIYSLPDDEEVVISLEQLLYLFLSDNPREDNHLLDITKKVIAVSRKSNKASCSVKNLKSIINYTSISGLNEKINSEIYDLLIIDQLIIKNNEMLTYDYDIYLNELNNGLIENYNIKKNNLIEYILNN